MIGLFQVAAPAIRTKILPGLLDANTGTLAGAHGGCRRYQGLVKVDVIGIKACEELGLVLCQMSADG